MSKSHQLDLNHLPKHRADGKCHYRPDNIYAAALAYRRAGLSFMPIAQNGTKMPAFDMLPWLPDENGTYGTRWNIFRQRLPSLRDCSYWFEDRRWFEMPGIAIIAGQVSGGLEILDVDNADSFEQFYRLLRKRSRRLIDKIVWIKSPRPGVHGYYRCSEPGRGQKLARRPE
jgi:hypothetical protein